MGSEEQTDQENIEQPAVETEEILSRGRWSILIGGFAIATASGAGVALSCTNGGISALVGVAISASLLPPIVNCGMCFSLITISSFSLFLTQIHTFLFLSSLFPLSLSLPLELCLVTHLAYTLFSPLDLQESRSFGVLLIATAWRRTKEQTLPICMYSSLVFII